MPTSISGLPTSAVLVVRPTLPPSWTPTPTRTETPTPTFTQTPTITLTPGIEEICAGVPPAQIGNYGEVIVIVVETNSQEVGLNLQLTNSDNGEEFEVQFPGGQQLIASLPVNDLPGSGTYEWTMTAFTVNETGLCEQTGSFVVFAPPPLAQLIDVLADGGIGVTPAPEPTATPTPEVTPEATAEATIETTSEATSESQ